MMTFKQLSLMALLSVPLAFAACSDSDDSGTAGLGTLTPDAEGFGKANDVFTAE